MYKCEYNLFYKFHTSFICVLLKSCIYVVFALFIWVMVLHLCRVFVLYISVIVLHLCRVFALFVSVNMKQTLQSQFLNCFAPCPSSDILPSFDYGTSIKSLHTKAVSDYKSLLTHDCVLQTAFPQIAQEEANLPRPYMTTLFPLLPSFCSYLHSYREKIGLIPSPLCLYCGVEPHTTVHVSPVPPTRHPWSLFDLPFIDFPPLPPRPPDPSSSGGQECLGQSS